MPSENNTTTNTKTAQLYSYVTAKAKHTLAKLRPLATPCVGRHASFTRRRFHFYDGHPNPSPNRPTVLLPQPAVSFDRFRSLNLALPICTTSPRASYPNCVRLLQPHKKKTFPENGNFASLSRASHKNDNEPLSANHIFCLGLSFF